MPGVTITTAVRTGPAITGIAPDSTFFVVGQTERGTDSVAKRVSSLDEYTTYYGGYEADKYTYSTVRAFFEEGGATCYVARATATAAVKAFRDVTVTSAATGIKLTAVGKGTWGNNIAVTVTVAGGLMDVSLTYSGVEFFAGSSFTNITALVTALQNDAIVANYVSVALLAGTTGTEDLGAVTGSLATGTNGSIAISDHTSALAYFTGDLGGGCVAIPGVATGTSNVDNPVYTALKANAVTFNRIALCSFANDQTVSAVRTSSAAFGAAGDTGHEHVAFFYPWVQIPSGSSGVTLQIPPEGFAAAARSRTHNSTGPWKPYAGVSSNAKFVTGVVTAVSQDDGDLLDGSRVNPIRVISNDIRIYGARSHSLVTEQWRFITAREVINYVVNQANIALEPLVFSTIDGRKTIYADITAALQSVLEPVRIAGGLYEGFNALGKRLDYGYTIKVDDSLNPLSQLESGLIKAQVGIRVSTVGDKITVNIVKSNLTTALV